jgi:hypothetical protein
MSLYVVRAVDPSPSLILLARALKRKETITMRMKIGKKTEPYINIADSGSSR